MTPLLPGWWRVPFAILLVGWTTLQTAAAPTPLPCAPDMVVAADGRGTFATIQAALESIPTDNRERRIIFIRDGLYAEKLRVDAPFITLRGESRNRPRIVFAQGREEFQQAPDELGAGVVNLSAVANDCVLENLTIENTHGVIGPHAFAVSGRADRTVIVDCDIFSQGADTLALWREGGGRYYHARLNVRGSVDFICPRGWCFMRDSTITQVNPHASAAIWHDGSKNPDMKFVLRGCRFDGPPDWLVARWHHDAQFFLLDCSFSTAMRDRAPYRVSYPTDGGSPTEADSRRNRELDATNLHGERVYFFNSHRTGGDYAWHRDNLATAPGAPAPESVTAAWTLGHTWDPERTDAPIVRSVAWGDGRIFLACSESVTVKGTPFLVLHGGHLAPYHSGSGRDKLEFLVSENAPRTIVELNLDRGTILATEAGATLRFLNPALP